MGIAQIRLKIIDARAF